ncbi:MAG TPA: hypothetical protein VGK70_03960, partial [Thermoanaerobaculia bacterium]
GGPNLRFAVEHFADWNGRFSESSIFAPWFWNSEVPRLGSAWGVLQNQVRLGTIGLLSMPDTTSWFTGHPLIGPPLLTALGIVGLGWILGRRLFFGAVLLALLAASNFAAVTLTTGTPAPQRVSSLALVLAILGGIAAGGFLEQIPSGGPGRISARGTLGVLLIGSWIGRAASGFPLDWGRHAWAGGLHAAFVQSASALLSRPWTRSESIFLHGKPYVDSGFPSFPYLLTERKLVDAEPGTPLEPGIHVFSPEHLEAGRRQSAELGISHLALLAHPAYPLRDVGCVFRVRRKSREGQFAKTE